MGLDAAKALVRAAESGLADFECEIDSVAVMELVSESGCSACDCEFVALTRSMGISLKPHGIDWPDDRRPTREELYDRPRLR